VKESIHHDHPNHTSLRLWLRLLTCTKLIENRVRGQLRESFETTLPRFDLMAQLYRHADGLKMGELSQRLMVTSGNVTGVTDQLEKDGLVERVALAGDRRAYIVRLTDVGRETFEEMASAHEAWIVESMSSLTAAEQQQLYDLLSKLKQPLQETMPQK
jgi:DNA-binding MarR family transcriptional regulator